MNALIIDDELDICLLLSSILRKKNFATHSVNSISAAPMALNRDMPGIVFLDNHLPDGMGIDFIPFIKTNYPQSKIVMITAHDGPADREKALGRGADVFLGKPFTKESISTVINSIFN